MPACFVSNVVTDGNVGSTLYNNTSLIGLTEGIS